jgi:tetratricopeptide (TPR) repeat protein
MEGAMTDPVPTATEVGISPAGNASRWWERAALLWKGLVKFALQLVGVVIFVGIIAILIDFLTQRTIAIEPISVPRRFANNGYTPDVAARRLRDALNKYAEDANTHTISPEWNKYAKNTNARMRNPELALRGDLPEFVVPTIGLSLEGVVAYIRIFFPDTRRRNISGEFIIIENQLRLLLRKNGIVFYTGADAVDLKNLDALFAAAAPKVFEVTEPYYNAMALSQTDPMKGLEMAKRIVDDWPDSDPNVIWSYILVGSILQNKHRLDEAIFEYRNAIRLDPDFATAHYNLGSALYEQDKIDDAIAEYRNAIGLDPHFASVHAGLASAFNVRGKISKSKAQQDLAIAEYRKAINRDPGNATAHYNYGLALRGQGKLQQAIDEFMKTVGLNPRHAAAHYDLGITLHGQGKTDEAIRELHKAIEFDSHSAAAHYNLAVALHGTGNADQAKAEFETAIAEYRKLIERDARDATAHKSRGDVLFAIEDLNGAIADYTKAIEIERHYVDAFAARGDANFTLTRYEAAVFDFSRAVQHQPDNAYLVLWLYLARARLGSPSAAAELQTSAAKLKQPNWPYPVVELFLGGRVPEATLAAASNANESCEAQFYIGEWHLLRDNHTAAAEPLKAAAATCPTYFIESTAARAELGRLGR